jgi:hypothetical protein
MGSCTVAVESRKTFLCNGAPGEMTEGIWVFPLHFSVFSLAMATASGKLDNES